MIEQGVLHVKHVVVLDVAVTHGHVARATQTYASGWDTLTRICRLTATYLYPRGL